MLRFITILILLISVPTLAQNGAISGTITDSSSGEKLIGIAVTTTSGSGSASDLNGQYMLSLKPGKHLISFSGIGFNPREEQFDVKAGETITRDIKLDPVSTDLGIAVVSAGKFEQDISELTVSMEVLKPSLIEDKNTVQMDEILQQTPGVAIVDNEPQIRSGSGYSFGAGSRVMILVDDLPMLSGDAGRPSWGFLPVENVEQVEVIKGASSVLYGSAALSGVINIRTAYPTGAPKTKVNVYHGMYSDPQTSEAKYWDGTPRISGMNFFHSRKIGRLSLIVGGSVLGDDGHLGPIHDENGEPGSSAYDPTKVDRYDAETRGRINMNLRVQSEKILGLSYGINTNWLKGESMSTLLWGNDTTGLYSTFSGAATRTKQVIGNVDPYVEYLSAKGSHHSLRGRWQKLDNDNDNDQGNFSDVLYGEYQIQHNFDSLGIKELTATGGLVGIVSTSEAELYSGGNTDGNNEARNYAAFLQLDKKFFNKLNVSAGLRYEYFDINGTSESRPVFRSGATYAVTRATFVRASFGQGYRFPTIAERHIRTAVGVINIFPNEQLTSESSYNAEFGVKQGFKIGGFKGYFDIAYFQQEYEDFIEFTFGQWNPVATTDNFFGLGFKSVNTGNSKVTGLDISIVGQGSIGPLEFNVLAGYTYANPTSTTPHFIYDTSAVEGPATLFDDVNYISTSSDTSGYVLKYRLEHLLRADLQIDYKNISFGTSLRGNSHMKNIDSIFEELDMLLAEAPGIGEWRERHKTSDFVVDTRLSYSLNETHKIALVVSNLLNHEYAIRPGAIEPPRTTTIQYTFNL